jgi:hypothetical protein
MKPHFSHSSACSFSDALRPDRARSQALLLPKWPPFRACRRRLRARRRVPRAKPRRGGERDRPLRCPVRYRRGPPTRMWTTSRANSAGRAVTGSHRPGFDRTVVLRRPGDGDTFKLGDVDLRVSTATAPSGSITLGIRAMTDHDGPRGRVSARQEDGGWRDGCARDTVPPPAPGPLGLALAER